MVGHTCILTTQGLLFKCMQYIAVATMVKHAKAASEL